MGDASSSARMAVADCVVVVVAGASVVEVNGEYGARAPGVVMEKLAYRCDPDYTWTKLPPSARACARVPTLLCAARAPGTRSVSRLLGVPLSPFVLFLCLSSTNAPCF